MSLETWNPWTIAALVVSLVMAAALVTGLVVANWTGPALMAALPARIPDGAWIPAPAGGAVAPSAVPLAAVQTALTPAVAEACNEYAAKQVARPDRATVVAYREAFALCLRARGYRDGRAP